MKTIWIVKIDERSLTLVCLGRGALRRHPGDQPAALQRGDESTERQVRLVIQGGPCRFISPNQLMLCYTIIIALWSLLLLFVCRIACGRGHMRCPYISPINVLLWKSYWNCHCIVLVHKIYTQVPFSTQRTDNFKRTLIIWQLNVITAGNSGTAPQVIWKWILISAVKRSIGFTIGFHNHGEGPY